MKKLTGTSLVGGSVSRERVENDYYATPSNATRMLLERLELDGIPLKGSILEPACGGGHLSEVLESFYPDQEIVSTDLINRGYEKFNGEKDFLNDTFESYNNVITNPPFKFAQEFIQKGLEVATDKVIMFAKIQLLEGVKRKTEIYDINPPNYIYVHSARVTPLRNGEETDENGKPWASTMCFAWFIWEKGNDNETIVRWL